MDPEYHSTDPFPSQPPIAIWSTIQASLGVTDEILHYIVLVAWVLHLLEASYLTSRTINAGMPFLSIIIWAIISFILGFPGIQYYNRTAARSGTKTD